MVLRKESRNTFPFRVRFAAVLLVSICVSQGSTVNAAQIQWDLVNLDFDTFILTAGGSNSALAGDGSKITFTGSGMFSDNGQSQPASGGGDWTTFGPADGNGARSETGSGTYTVTSLVSWTPLVGMINPGITDTIGNLADARAGLAFFEVDYSDGNTGHLFVSCALRGVEPPESPLNTPLTIFEGILADKGSVGYSFPDPPPALNLTLFHVPEPSTMTFALCILPVLGLYRRLRRN